MEVATHRLQGRLERFDLEALFLRDLGWQRAGPPGQLPQFTLEDCPVAGELRVLAIAPAATVIALGWQPDFTPAVRAQIYGAIAAAVPDPLLIFGQRDRSLWLWGRSAEPAPVIYSRVWVRSQPIQDWGAWLGRLSAPQIAIAGSLHQALNPDYSALVQDGVQGFKTSLHQLTTHIQGLPGPAERQQYALVVLTRLMAIVALQQRGFLDGDDWYLHNKYGQSQQGGADRFFSHWLCPLWRQGFTLPTWERSAALHRLLGEVPFLPNGLFQRQPWEHRYPTIAIPDRAFEAALNWLGDLATAVAPDSLLGVVSPLLERVAVVDPSQGEETPNPLLTSLCDRLVHTALANRLTTLGAKPYASVADGMMNLDAAIAAPLLETLGQLSVLDPACGSGRYLIALTRQMTDLMANLVGIVRQSPVVPWPLWLQTAAAKGNPGLLAQGQWMTRNLFGIDLSVRAITLAQLHWFLSLLPQVQTVADLTSLPDPFLNLQVGNALVGLLAVDSQRFDQVQDKANLPGPEPATALQGNLLQPLLAEDYQTVLRERQIRLEHYRSQTHLLAESGGVPGYVQVEFLRDRIEDLNRTAQGKLNQLLLNEFSQQLGIGYRQPDPQGRSRRRPLDLADIEALTPFHWGFQFDDQVVRLGGFDLVISRVPWGPVEASTEDFCQGHANLLAAKDITLDALRHHRRTLLTLDQNLAAAWGRYRGQVQSLSTYFRRADAYPHATQPPPGQRQLRLYWERLFLERILALLRPNGLAALVLPTTLWHQANAQPLRQWLRQTVPIGPIVEISNHQGAIAHPPSRQDLSLVWLGPGHPDLGSLTWVKEAAPTADALEVQLQGLIYLGKELV